MGFGLAWIRLPSIGLAWIGLDWNYDEWMDAKLKTLNSHPNALPVLHWTFELSL